MGRNIELKEGSEELITEIAEAGPSTQRTLVLDTMVPARKSSRVSRPLERYGFLHEHDFKSFLVGVSDHDDDLRNYEETILDRDSGKRLEVMDLKI